MEQKWESLARIVINDIIKVIVIIKVIAIAIVKVTVIVEEAIKIIFVNFERNYH